MSCLCLIVHSYIKGIHAAIEFHYLNMCIYSDIVHKIVNVTKLFTPVFTFLYRRTHEL